MKPVTPAPDVPKEASFIWVNDNAPLRNQFVRFQRRFVLDKRPRCLPFNCFADTRYRIEVNGHFVGAGPGRFVTNDPAYDTYDLSPHLRPGVNTIEVLVNYYGAPSYQHMPDGQPGFIAWGGRTPGEWATPGQWTAQRMVAWDHNSPAYSFAQPPVELCDTRKLHQGPTVPLRMYAREEMPWGPLRPYNGVPLTWERMDAARITVMGPLESEEERYGFMACDPDGEAGSGQRERPWIQFATWLHSAHAQEVPLSCFWSDLALNGNPLTLRYFDRGNRGETLLNLRAGWNCLQGEVEVLRPHWAYLLGLPAHAGVTLRAQPRLDDDAVFLCSPVGPRGETPDVEALRQSIPDGWKAQTGDVLTCTPARLMAWDRPGTNARHDLPLSALPNQFIPEAKAAVWCLAFDGAFLGHVVVDVEAPPGSMLDVAYDDWLGPDGCLDLYRSHPFIDSADRFVLSGGRQTVTLFHPRGGKYLQVVLRAPGGIASPRLVLHDVWVRSRQIWNSDPTSFQCDDPVITAAWPVSLRTLRVSTDDAYTDCPWRERALYGGDAYVALQLNLLLDNDPRMPRRMLQLFSRAQISDGQLPACVPSCLPAVLHDYTLLWIGSLHAWWAHTGDLEQVQACWPAVLRIWDSTDWDGPAEGLWNAHKAKCFVDWGCPPEERSGSQHAALNILRIAAYRWSADLADALDQRSEAERFRALARGVEDLLTRHVWDDTRGCFRSAADKASPALHANAWALAFCVGSEAQRAAILSYLEPWIYDNLNAGLSYKMSVGYWELYFLSYLLEGLGAHRRPDLAERILQDHYGYLLEKDFDTWPEFFRKAEQGGGSRCHPWSGAPTLYAARYILGVRPGKCGHTQRWLFDPVTQGIHRAAGRVAHPDGWIEVDWERRNGTLSASLKAPPGIVIERVRQDGREV